MRILHKPACSTSRHALAASDGSDVEVVEYLKHPLDRAELLDLIARLRHAVPVPLVLHGSSGVADETIEQAIRAGITKVNVSTHLNRFYTDAIRGYLDAHPEAVDPRKYIWEGRAAVTAEAARLMTVFDVASRDGATRVETGHR